ncbi:MAG TPA: polyprenyl diphosphate synthase [Thermoanaerobaculia bacterium]|nr:polyprenyl diphosphate synthase [Thermoanaerobaculia bacterium]
MVSTPVSAPSAETRPRLLPHVLSIAKEWIKRPFYRLYERRLEGKVAEWVVPQHIGIIMDGNRRYAKRAGSSSVSFGHARGAEKLHQVLGWCYDAGIPVVSVWSFSLDNFQRDTTELESLFQLFEDKTRELAHRSEVHTNDVRVRYIGKLELLPESLREAIRAAEEATAGYERYHLNIAMAYGGREEITDAVRHYLADQAARGRSLDDAAAEFDDRAIEPYLYTSGLPEPDLILRTSGEVRLSGFLLWQSCYSELFFCDANWPAFRKIDFLRALRSYHQRQRRFGR